MASLFRALTAILLVPISIANASAIVYPKKFDGICKEVGTNRKQKSKIGIDFKDFPQAVELIQNVDGTRIRAELNKPIRTSPDQDRYVILENISESSSKQFTLRYYGTLYGDGPYFYDMPVDYTLDQSDQLNTHQVQITYYQGKVSRGNEWNCNYKRY